MNDKLKESASDFLSPSGWISAAKNAHPAFKYAIVVGGLAALVATVTKFRTSPATLVFGIIIVVVFLVLFFVFAQAARIQRHNLSFAALFLVWAFLCISIGTALLLFTSAFFNAPLPFHDYIVRSLGLLPQATTLLSTPTPAPKIWHREDESGAAYQKTFRHNSDNMHNVPNGYLASGTYSLEVPNARIYQVDFQHDGPGKDFNYHPTNAPPHEYDGCTEILPDGKSFTWKRRWAGKPTTESYTALYEVFR